MLFNSFIFLFAFLPVVLAGAYVLARWSPLAVAWLLAASLVFYGWWDRWAVPVLLVSIGFNYLVARRIEASGGKGRSWWLAAGVSGNLAALAFYKYRVFILGNLDGLLGTTTLPPAAALPLGISFFTFTQIAFLVDLKRREATVPALPRYGLFVTFFPHLIAGPLYHHAQVMPQFSRPGAFRLAGTDFVAGLDLLAIGLFKKCVIADSLAPYADIVFGDAGKGIVPGTAAAWAAILCYTFQIYFDFSGYSDMAMGLARMLGIRLPANFEAPYRAANIVEFWRRWHMTLSAFLRDYLYIPLGGNRHGKARRYVNLLATMSLGGLWHGAAWTFVLWGALHGLMLCVNHFFHAVFPVRAAGWPRKGSGIALTFTAVALGWVLFRAPDIPSAVKIYTAAFGHGVAGAEVPIDVMVKLAVAALVAFALPVSWKAVERVHAPVVAAAPRAGLAFGVISGILLFAAIKAMNRETPSPFLYFNF